VIFKGSRFEVRGSRFEVRGSRFEVRGSRFEKFKNLAVNIARFFIPVAAVYPASVLGFRSFIYHRGAEHTEKVTINDLLFVERKAPLLPLWFKIFCRYKAGLRVADLAPRTSPYYLRRCCILANFSFCSALSSCIT